jgi:hypothetical protein
MNIVDAILSGNIVKARELIENKVDQLIVEKLDERKLQLAELLFIEDTSLEEGNFYHQGRSKVIRVRVRGGKIQRGKKQATLKGHTIRKGKLVKMTPLEIRNRQLGSRQSAIKRRSKMNQIMRSRKISLRKRGAHGLR